MNKKYTFTTAFVYSVKGELEQWVHEFLCGEGKNKDFSNGLKLCDRYYYGPKKMKLNLFERCYGPEENMKYVSNGERFNLKVDKMIDEINRGWDIPPLIIKYENNIFELNDGNHRYEALIKANFEEYYVIIWATEKSDMDGFISKYEKRKLSKG